MNFNEIFNESKGSKLKIIKPKASKTSKFTSLDNIKNAIFLAGPCPREDYANNDWRTDAFKILEDLAFDGYAITPTNDNYDASNSDELKQQTMWEYEAMHKASAIVFWTDRTEKNPGFTTNCEIFDYIDCPGVYIGMPDGVTKNANRYIRIHAEKRGVPIFSTLEDTLAAVVKDLNRGSQNWYISDTHFSQERAMTLSRRPYKTVQDMDLDMISNWNKRIRKNDIVYHLGDFGENGKYLDCLNFKTLKFIKGNYERDGKSPDVLKDMKDREDIEIFDNDECKVESGGFKYTLRHEPVSGNTVKKEETAIYGHIHGRQLIKKNGVDVGVDAHKYCPTSQEEVDFYANALEKGYYDEQVFTETCR